MPATAPAVDRHPLTRGLSEGQVIRRTATPALWAMFTSYGKWFPARHLMHLDRATVDTLTGKDGIRKMVVQMPPRHGKSEYSSKFLPSWFRGSFPDKSVLFSSYGAGFASEWGAKARDLLLEFGPAVFGVTVDPNKDARDNWGVLDCDGQMYSVGAGGAMTGRGADLLIVDDPIKTAEEAESQAFRDKLWDWWNTSALTRLEPGGCAIIIHTRWHEDDLIGRLLQEEADEWRCVRLPAIAEENDQLGRAEGEALWPERWPLERRDAITGKLTSDCLLGKQRSMDVRWWDALYQQRPRRPGNVAWPDEYFGRHIWLSEGYFPKPHEFQMHAIAVDPSKGKNAKKGDYSGIVHIGWMDGKLYVDADLERRPSEKIVRDTIIHYQQRRPIGVGIEENAFQFLLAPMITQQCIEMGVPPFPIFTINNTISKEIRILRLGPYLANKMVRFADTPGCRLLVAQLKEFPLGDHDDGPDAMEMGLRLMDSMAAASGQEDDVTFERIAT